MSASPARTAVTRPELSTVATNVFDELHVAIVVTVWLVPFANFATALAWVDCPTVGVPLSKLTATEVAGTVATASPTLPVFPSVAALMVATPGATAVTSPVDETTAIALFEVDQAKTLPVRLFPFESRAMALA